MPVVTTPATPAPAATRTTAPTLPRSRGSSSSTIGRASRSRAQRGGVERRPPREREHSRVGDVRHERRQQLRRDRLAGERAEAAGEVGRQLRRQPLERLRVGGRDQLDLGAEAQRVLERVEALEDREPLVPARSLEALRQPAHAMDGRSARGSAASVASRLTAWISSGSASRRTLRMKSSSAPSGLKKSS